MAQSNPNDVDYFLVVVQEYITVKVQYPRQDFKHIDLCALAGPFHQEHVEKKTDKADIASVGVENLLAEREDDLVGAC